MTLSNKYKYSPGEKRSKLQKGEYAAFLIILLMAFLFRGIYFFQIKDGVIFHSYRLSHLDMNFFNSWARIIKTGNWLSEGSLHPFHDWHRRYGSYQEWIAWYGENRFHQSPLYPYLLAALYQLGLGITGVKTIQALLGFLVIALIYLIARQLSSAKAAILAALLALFYGPFYLYESQLLRTTWILLGGVLSIYLCLKAGDKNTLSGWFWLGLNLGLLFLLKAGFIIWAFFVLIWIGYNRDRCTPVWRAYLLVLIAFGLCLIPLAVRNHLVGAPLLSSSSIGAATFTFGNAEDVSGTKFETSSHTREIMIESQGKFWPTVVLTLRTHTRGFSSVGRLLVRKFFAFWKGHETPGNANFYYARLHSSFLRRCSFTFSIIGPLGLLGLFLSLRKWRQFLLLYLYLLSIVIQVVLFYHLSRFRLPATPVLIVFAGSAIAAILSQLRSKKKMKGLVMILILLLLHMVLSPSQDAAKSKISCDDFLTVAGFYALKEDFVVALSELDLALRIYPQQRERIEKYREDVLRIQEEAK